MLNAALSRRGRCRLTSHRQNSTKIGLGSAKGKFVIIVRTPLRVSFFGGGTDHPSWFSRPAPGAVLSTSIDKFIYIQLRKLPAVFEFNYRVAWGMLEEVKSL
jgi:hypothetical protein